MNAPPPPAGPDPLLRIGHFSRASLISVRTLRAHHERGLLVPAEVDPHTGYRSYRVSQLADAAVIRRLRGLDLPLTDVARILAARDPEVTRAVIEEHAERMRARLDDVARIVEELQRSEALPGSQTPVHLRDEPATHALAVRARVAHGAYGPFLADAYRRLLATVETTGAQVTGPGAALHPASIDSGTVHVTAYLPIEAPVEVGPTAPAGGVALELVPAARCAVLTHVGSYDEIGEAYRQLGSWVAGHAAPVAAPVREHYVVSVEPATGQLLPDDRLRTEIAWPVRPRTAPPTEEDHR